MPSFIGKQTFAKDDGKSTPTRQHPEQNHMYILYIAFAFLVAIAAYRARARPSMPLSAGRARPSDPLSAGRALALRFIDLGNMQGKTMDEIIAEVGAPSARSAVAGGILLQWQAPGYHIAVSFDANGTFRKITHESHQFQT